MRSISLLLVSFVLTGYCGGQAQAKPTDPAVKAIVSQFQSATEARNAALYASLFASDATWFGVTDETIEGPTEGPSFIERAARRMFEVYGAFLTDYKRTQWLSDNFVIVDFYQRFGRGRQEALQRAPLLHVPSSMPEPWEDDMVRTTLLVAKQNGTWKIIAARLSDLRAHSDN